MRDHSPPTPANLRKPVVLVVEDDPATCALLSELLDYDLNCTVLQATNPEDVLAYMRSSTIDLAILDLIMPEVNGLDLYDMILADPKTRRIPVLFMTALPSPTELEMRGISDYILKPFDLDEFEKRVNDLIS